VGGKELIDLISQMYSLNERGEAPCECLPKWPDSGTYSAHTPLIKNLYEQQWVNLGYNIMQKTVLHLLYKQIVFKKYKASELGENVCSMNVTLTSKTRVKV
jgi:hypothetical protein